MQNIVPKKQEKQILCLHFWKLFLLSNNFHYNQKWWYQLLLLVNHVLNKKILNFVENQTFLCPDQLFLNNVAITKKCLLIMLLSGNWRYQQLFVAKQCFLNIFTNKKLDIWFKQIFSLNFFLIFSLVLNSMNNCF